VEHAVGYDFMHIFKNSKIQFLEPISAVIGQCPNCARQDQIFPNISKRNQKYDEKSKLIQVLEITFFLNSKIPALRIRRPQVKKTERIFPIKAYQRRSQIRKKDETKKVSDRMG
jgi:hypothetical protein